MTDLPPGIDGGETAEAVEELPIGKERADVRRRTQVVPHPRQDDLRRPPKGRVGRIVDVAGALVIGHQQAHGGPTDFARQLDPVPRIDDRPGVHDRHRRRDLIDLPPLKEEWPQFGEEERKALVDLNLRDIRLDLREVGVVGEVERQIRREPVLHIEAALFDILPPERARLPVQLAHVNRRDRGQQLEVPAGREIAQALEHPHLANEPHHVARHRCPDGGFVPVFDVPLEL